MLDRLPFEFAAPWYLGLLLFLPGVVWLARRSLAGLAGPRRLASIVIRCLVLLLLVLALAELRLTKRNDRLAVVFVVDRSESVPAEQREAARQYVAGAAEGRSVTREDMVGAVAFGKVAGVEALPKQEPLDLDSFITLIEPEATNLAAAIRLAVATFPESVGKRIVLLSDGNENRENALEEARTAQSQGVTIDVVPITYAYSSEVSIEKLLVDPEVNVGQPFNVRVVVDSIREIDAILRLYENNALVSGEDSRVKLHAGRNVFDFQRRLELAGKYDYEARIEPVRQGDDSVLQNNTAFGFTFIHGEPRVLLCAAEPDLERPLINALNAEKIAVAAVTPAFLPRAIEEYFNFQAIVLSNVAAHELSEDQMKVFEVLVKDVGIGFVMIGGENSFGAGGYQGTPVERLLPVDMEIKQRKVLPNGALAMVVHSCELGNGNWWASQVVQRAIGILSPRDYAGVLFYDYQGGDTWLFPMTLVAQRQMMISRLKNFNPGDMMSFQGIMQMGFSGLQGTRASIKHMIVLSDGDPTMPGQGLVNQIKGAGITISTICYGAHGGVPPGMKLLAQQGGGKHYFLQGPEQLPEIFIREASTVQKALISEETFLPILAARGAILQGISQDELPQLDGYVLTSPKELASLLLLRPPGPEQPVQDPILAAWSYGLGKSVAFTSDAGRRWGKRWAAWQGYQRFWGQCLRWVSRPKNDERFRVTRGIEGERGSISIDAITPAGEFVNGLRFDGRVTAPDFETQPVSVRQVAPGRYELDFPVSRRGTYTVSLGYIADGRQSTYVTALSVPYSAEHRRLETNHELLRRLAGAGGGKYYPDPAEPLQAGAFFARDFPFTRSIQDIWPQLLRAAVALFFIDVFLRRVVVNYLEVTLAGLRRLAAVLRRRQLTAAPADARLATLLERKAQLRAAAASRPSPRFVETRRPAAAPELGHHTDAGAALRGLKEAEVAAGSAPGVEPGETPAEAPPREATYTSRLLEAKRRALRQGDEGKKT